MASVLYFMGWKWHGSDADGDEEGDGDGEGTRSGNSGSNSIHACSHLPVSLLSSLSPVLDWEGLVSLLSPVSLLSCWTGSGMAAMATTRKTVTAKAPEMAIVAATAAATAAALFSLLSLWPFPPFTVNKS